jgi:CHAT domain-containing protein/tetratricopeptide (TPR) repeat protein
MAKHADQEALKLAEEASKIARKALRVDSEEFIRALNYLATINLGLERYEIAEAILREIVDGVAASGEPQTEEYAATLNNLAVACMRLDREEEGFPYMERAIALKRKLFGTERTEYLTNLEDMARTLADMDRCTEAVPYFEEMCEIIRGETGETHPEFAKALQNLAIALHRSGRDEDAAVHRRRAAEILGVPAREEAYFPRRLRSSVGPATEPEDERDREVEEALKLYAQGERARAQAIHRRVLGAVPQLPLPSIFSEVMGNPLDPFLAHVGELDVAGLRAEESGDLTGAAAIFEQVTGILEVSLGHKHPRYAGALNNVAQVRRKQRRFEDAKEVFGAALEILDGMAEDQSPKSVIATNIAALYFEIANEAASNPYEGDLSYEDLFVQKPKDYTVAARVRFPIPIDGELPVSNTMRWLDARAKFYESAGAFDKTWFLYRLIVELCTLVRGGHHRDLIDPLDTLAVFEIERGEFADAKEHLAAAVSVAELAGEESQWQLASILRRQATLLSNMGQTPAAERPMLRAIEIFRQAGVSDSQLLLLEEDLAVLHLRMGKIELARPILEKLLATVPVEELEESNPMRLQQLATFADVLKDNERALQFYEASIRGQRERTGEWTAAFARTLSNYATALRMKGRWQAAEAQYHRAIEIRRVQLGPDHPDLMESLIRLALVLAALDRPDEAFATINEVLEIGARLTGRLSLISSDASRLDLVQRQLGYLGIALSVVLGSLSKNAEAVKRAYLLVLRRKALAGQVLVVQRNAILAGRYPHLEDKLRELDRLRAEVGTIAMQLQSSSDPDERARLLSEALDERSSMEAELAGEIDEMKLGAPLAATTVEAVSAALPSESVLIEFVELRPHNFKAVLANGDAEFEPRRYIAFVLPADQPDALSLLDFGEAEEIDRLVGQSAGRLAAGRDLSLAPVEAAATVPGFDDKYLSSLIVSPILANIGEANRILIAPDGNLFLVAFDALPIDATMLVIDKYEVSYVGTGRDTIRFAVPGNATLGNPVIVAAPDFDLSAATEEAGGNNAPDVPAEPAGERAWLGALARRFSPLPGTVVEGEEIHKRLANSRLLSGKEALEKRVREMKRPRIVHFATHGFAIPNSNNEAQENDNSMFRSGLALAGANSWLAGRPLPVDAEDGIITAEDIATLDLIETELAVLSACETGVGDVLSGEGVFGLRRAFSVAGVRSIVMSLWKVPDAETCKLMVLFYDHLLAGKSKPAALRAAKLALRETSNDRRSWGAFIHEGDWHPLRGLGRS